MMPYLTIIVITMSLLPLLLLLVLLLFHLHSNAAAFRCKKMYKCSSSSSSNWKKKKLLLTLLFKSNNNSNNKNKNQNQFLLGRKLKLKLKLKPMLLRVLLLKPMKVSCSYSFIHSFIDHSLFLYVDIEETQEQRETRLPEWAQRIQIKKPRVSSLVKELCNIIDRNTLHLGTLLYSTSSSAVGPSQGTRNSAGATLSAED